MRVGAEIRESFQVDDYHFSSVTLSIRNKHTIMPFATLFGSTKKSKTTPIHTNLYDNYFY